MFPKLKEAFRLSGIPVLVASLCCLAPIVLVVFGLSSVAFAASLTDVPDGQYRWLFILVGLTLLAITLIFYFRKKGICTLDQAKRRRTEIINKTILVLAVAIVGYVLFFFVFLTYIGKILQIWE